MNNVQYTAVACDRQSGLLWLAAEPSKDSLFTFNPATGLRKNVSSLPFATRVVGMAFNGQNKLHALLDNGSSEFYLVTINTSTYEATPVSDSALPVTGLISFAMDPDLIVTSVSGELPIPLSYALDQNYPNPFNPETRIGYRMKERGWVKVAVHDLLDGRLRYWWMKRSPPGSSPQPGRLPAFRAECISAH